MIVYSVSEINLLNKNQFYINNSSNKKKKKEAFSLVEIKLKKKL